MLRLPSIPFPSLPFPSLLLPSLPFSSLSFLSLPFHSSHCGFRIPDTGFQFLSVELGFCISIVCGIPDSLGCIPDSIAQDFGFLQLYSGFQSTGFRIPPAVLRIPKRRIPDTSSCTPHSKAQDSGFLQLYCGFQSPSFRIPPAVLRIPEPRIPDSCSSTADCKAQDSGIPPAVFRFPEPRIPDSYSCTADSKAQDSGFHKHKISQIPESGFPYMDLYKIWVVWFLWSLRWKLAYVVVQFYPWFKFYFPLFQTYYPRTKKKDQIEPQHIHSPYSFWNEECLQLLNYFIIRGKLSLWACRKKIPPDPSYGFRAKIIAINMNQKAEWPVRKISLKVNEYWPLI